MYFLNKVIMKKNVLFSTLLMTFLGTANAGEFDKVVDPFTTVVATRNYAVTMIESTEEKVHVVNNDVDITDDRILITVTGGTLDIRLKNDAVKDRQIEIIVYYKKISHIESKKDCRITVNNVLKQDMIIFNCSTGGKIKADVEVATIKVKISNGGTLNVGGVATTAEYEISTGGTISAINLKAEIVSAKISMLGDISCAVSKKLTASVTSGGTIKYRGNPEAKEENIKLGGTITKLAD